MRAPRGRRTCAPAGSRSRVPGAPPIGAPAVWAGWTVGVDGIPAAALLNTLRDAHLSRMVLAPMACAVFLPSDGQLPFVPHRRAPYSAARCRPRPPKREPGPARLPRTGSAALYAKPAGRVSGDRPEIHPPRPKPPSGGGAGTVNAIVAKHGRAQSRYPREERRRTFQLPSPDQAPVVRTCPGCFCSACAIPPQARPARMGGAGLVFCAAEYPQAPCRSFSVRPPVSRPRRLPPARSSKPRPRPGACLPRKGSSFLGGIRLSRRPRPGRFKGGRRACPASRPDAADVGRTVRGRAV